MKNDTHYEPLVSIALTTFNGGDLLREQLESILTQTYKNFEVVISDDGSESYTMDVIHEYCEKDKRFSWSRSSLERGFRKNTENAINLCHGEIIVLCDQDDVWFKNKLQKHVDVYKDPKVMWAFNKCILTDSAGNKIGYLEDTLPDYYRHKNILENAWGSCIGAAQTSYRSELIKKALPIPLYCLAHDSWIQLAIYPAKPFFIDEYLNTYRQHQGNMIGLKFDDDPILFKTREKEAVEGNLKYLKLLISNTSLSFPKRVFIALVYIAKLIRRFFRKAVNG